MSACITRVPNDACVTCRLAAGEGQLAPPLEEVAERNGGGVDEWQSGVVPGNEPTVQRLRLDAFVPQPSGHALAEFQTFLARHYDFTARELRRPAGHILMRAADCARNQAWIVGKIRLDAHIDDGGRMACANAVPVQVLQVRTTLYEPVALKNASLSP